MCIVCDVFRKVLTMKVQDIKSDKRYRDIFTITKDERSATELLALSDGEIYQPLFVWKGQDVLIYGYQSWKILKAHPEIRYTIREIEFEGWQDAQVWAIEHFIAQPEVLIWQKLEAAVKCESYWVLKEEAKKAHGNRRKSSSASEGDSGGSKEVNAIIARKVGCGPTTVYNFKRVFSSGKTVIIKLCRKGELSINGAYSRLFTPKPPRKRKPDPSIPMELEIDGSDIFDECENNIDIGKKSTTRHNGVPVDPAPIAQKMRAAKIPDGAIWIALHKKDGQMQVVKRGYDEAKGNIKTKVNAYNCKVVSEDEDVIIFEADHINGGTMELSKKDDSEFDSEQKVAS